jgi:F420-dependent oxidoreductase-like protein
MRLGLQVGYTDPKESVALGLEAERLGFDVVWTSEAWGADAVTVASYIASRTERIDVGTAIMQIPARTPAATAMTVASLDHLSGGRFRLGLGTSGPQVVEGWHGEPWGKPLTKTREYIGVVRTALARKTVEFHGEHYDIPYSGNGATGLGKPLKLLLRPLRADVPVYLAANSPKNVALAAEIADGLLPIFVSPAHVRSYFGDAMRDGFDLAPCVSVVVGDDVQACRDSLKPYLALYVGGMGARGKNFYNDVVRRYGYDDAATAIQDAYLDGRRAEAAGLVPDALVDEIALVGPKERIAERLDAWREAGVTTLVASGAGVPELRVLAELLA